MLTRNRRKSGRGYSQEGWINHHRKTVEGSEKVSNVGLEETEKNIKEMEEENANISDRERGVGEYFTQPVTKTTSGKLNETNKQKSGTVGNIWIEKTSKSNENDMVQSVMIDPGRKKRTDILSTNSTVGTKDSSEQTTQSQDKQTISFDNTQPTTVDTETSHNNKTTRVVETRGKKDGGRGGIVVDISGESVTEGTELKEIVRQNETIQSVIGGVKIKQEVLAQRTTNLVEAQQKQKISNESEADMNQGTPAAGSTCKRILTSVPIEVSLKGSNLKAGIGTIVTGKRRLQSNRAHDRKKKHVQDIREYGTIIRPKNTATTKVQMTELQRTPNRESTEDVSEELQQAEKQNEHGTTETQQNSYSDSEDETEISSKTTDEISDVEMKSDVPQDDAVSSALDFVNLDEDTDNSTSSDINLEEMLQSYSCHKNVGKTFSEISKEGGLFPHTRRTEGRQNKNNKIEYNDYERRLNGKNITNLKQSSNTTTTVTRKDSVEDVDMIDYEGQYHINDASDDDEIMMHETNKTTAGIECDWNTSYLDRDLMTMGGTATNGNTNNREHESMDDSSIPSTENESVVPSNSAKGRVSPRTTTKDEYRVQIIDKKITGLEHIKNRDESSKNSDIGSTNGPSATSDKENQKTDKIELGSEKRKKQHLSKGRTMSSVPGTISDEHTSDQEWADIAASIEQSNTGHGSNQYNGIVTHNKKIAKKTRFSKYNTVIKTTTVQTHTNDTVKQRGIEMTEERLKLFTPVKIEYNLASTVTEFNIITAIQELFEQMAQSDPTFRFLHSETKEVLWEHDRTLPEDTQFTELFHMREQNFRKGNTKVTIHGTVESMSPVNRIKFTEPVKSFILDKNIWIKPDFYSTSTVSSPGFFTLLHPKITNKTQLIQDLTDSLKSTTIDKEETVYAEWCQTFGKDRLNEDIPVPKFHVETNLRKWGTIQAETINIYCASADAKVMKYLLVEASSQQKIRKGLFVPSGIHLLEGKDTLSKLLAEHVEFLKETTSFQVDGISYTEMKESIHGCGNLENILLQCQGIKAVEPTYQTEFRGQWMLVIKAHNANHVREYISKHLVKIYQHKRVQQSSVVTHQKNEHKQQSYKIALVENITSKVGTYAEVLTRRFNSPNPHGQQPDGIPKYKNTTLNESDSGSQAPSKGTHQARESATTGTNYPGTHAISRPKALNRNAANQTQQVQESKQTTQSETILTSTHHRIQAKFDSSHRTEVQESDEQKLSKKQDWIDKLMEMENKITAQQTEMNNRNSQMLTDLEKRMEQNIDRIMEDKMVDMSLAVADIVTKRLTKAMGKIVKGSNKTTIPTENMHDDTMVTQESPDSTQKNSNRIRYPNSSQFPQSGEISTGTQKMLTELQNIQTQSTQADPPHDINLNGSEGPPS